MGDPTISRKRGHIAKKLKFTVSMNQKSPECSRPPGSSSVSGLSLYPPAKNSKFRRSRRSSVVATPVSGESQADKMGKFGFFYRLYNYLTTKNTVLKAFREGKEVHNIIPGRIGKQCGESMLYPNQSATSSSSRAQQSSEDNGVVKGGEEVDECSQVAFISQSSRRNTNVHPLGDCRATEELSSNPCSEDHSVDAILKRAAKTFTGRPSILKKRKCDLVSPLLEKRDEKKLEGSTPNGFSQLEVMFDECTDKKGLQFSQTPNGRNFSVSWVEEENAIRSSGQEEYEDRKSFALSGNNMSK